MLFEQQQKTYRSSKLISGHPQQKRCSRRQSKLAQFKIVNPLSNLTGYMNNQYIPTMPSAIRSQLQGIQYLTLNTVNNIGKLPSNCNSPLLKRNSRFSKRLMAMQKALQAQQMKFNNIDTQNQPQTFYTHEQTGDGQFLSMMDEERNSMDMQFALHDNLDRDIDMEMGLDDMCEEESYATEVEFYSETQIRNINYQEYESYLNV